VTRFISRTLIKQAVRNDVVFICKLPSFAVVVFITLVVCDLMPALLSLAQQFSFMDI
jgi:hypothetical protein